MSCSPQGLTYLISSSNPSLESFELSRLNRASNLQKEMLNVLEEWIDAKLEARVARSILDGRRLRSPDSYLAYSSFHAESLPSTDPLYLVALPPQLISGHVLVTTQMQHSVSLLNAEQIFDTAAPVPILHRFQMRKRKAPSARQQLEESLQCAGNRVSFPLLGHPFASQCSHLPAIRIALRKERINDTSTWRPRHRTQSVLVPCRQRQVGATCEEQPRRLLLPPLERSAIYAHTFCYAP